MKPSIFIHSVEQTKENEDSTEFIKKKELTSINIFF